jgi:hypothetical protein
VRRQFGGSRLINFPRQQKRDTVEGFYPVQQLVRRQFGGSRLINFPRQQKGDTGEEQGEYYTLRRQLRRQETAS